MQPDERRPGDFGSTAISNKLPGSPLGQQKLTPTLVCFEGAERGKSFPIKQAELTIGRNTEAEIPVSDELASRRHARIFCLNPGSTEEPECYIEDMGSRNGTEINGKKISKKVRLRTLDRVQIGSTIYGFIIKDETEMRVQESFFELATQDALTGLNNRRQFMALVGHHFSKAQRTGSSTALLVIDADRFKNVNDELGHDVGDLVLVHIATVIRDCCRLEELPARWGGEEFVVLLPECDAEGASAAAERVRTTIESTPINLPDRSLNVTVSVGGAAMPRNPDFDTLFRLADQQLLLAKRAGRNRSKIIAAPRTPGSTGTTGY